MERELLIIGVIFLVGFTACLCWLFYTIGVFRGMEKMRNIDDKILDELSYF